VNNELERAADALRAASSIVVMGHVGPDGDALGAMLALAAAARNAGKEAYATFGEPFVLGRQFRYLDTTTLTSPGAVPPELDLAVVVDTGVPDRLGSALDVAGRTGRIVVIDHHISGDDGFGDIRVVDTGAAAASQIVCELLEELGWPLTPAIATALYTGIVTDTGRFQYEATSPAVHRMTARLLEAGVEPPLVGRHVYEEAPFGYLRVAGRVLQRAELDAAHGLVWSVLRRADLASEELRYEDADGLIDLLRIADESDVACLLREIGEQRYKGSLRSRGERNVADIAAIFGGGGHHNAAGFIAQGEAEAIIAQITARLA
jgi:phosphoesterase RecJ-like protein